MQSTSLGHLIQNRHIRTQRYCNYIKRLVNKSNSNTNFSSKNGNQKHLNLLFNDAPNHCFSREKWVARIQPVKNTPFPLFQACKIIGYLKKPFSGWNLWLKRWLGFCQIFLNRVICSLVAGVLWWPVNSVFDGGPESILALNPAWDLDRQCSIPIPRSSCEIPYLQQLLLPSSSLTLLSRILWEC